MRTLAYERITDRIIALLEQGTVPWHKPWKASTSWPANFVTKRPYRGINVFLLLTMNYESPFWLSFRQVQALGGSVRKGEKSCPVVFWKQQAFEDKESGETRKVPLLRFYHVFNIAQCDNLKGGAVEVEHSVATKPAEVIMNMPKPPALKHGMSCAFYEPHEDVIGMPNKDKFTSEDGYHASLFHELIHATGHITRLNRPALSAKAGFGSDPYCKEELIAELGAAFICGHAEIVERTIDNSAAYLQGWLKRLKNDKMLIVQASAQAQRAAEYVLGNTAQEKQTPATETAPQPEALKAAA